MLASDATIRLVAFLGVFALMALWELLAPLGAQTAGRWRRWPSNLAVVAIDSLCVRVLLPVSAVAVALAAEQGGWGLFPVLGWPTWAAVAGSILLLDLAIYLQHVLFHAVPALWRLHRMHHADIEFDVSTGVRFHPVEILLSMLIKLAVVAALGAPALAVLLFEVLLNTTSLFNHGNVRMPQAVDRVLRWFVVTPHMHRVHHSIKPSETNSNFGFNLPWWDRIFGTYRARPQAGLQGMTIGIEQFRDPRELALHRMLMQPLRGGSSAYPLSRPAADEESGA